MRVEDAMNALLAVLLAGLGSYLFRVGAVVAIDRFAVPDWFDRVSALVPPAVFAGLAATSLAGPIDAGVGTAVPVIAGATATVIVAGRRSAATAVFVGMLVLSAAQMVGAALGT
jgi:branched-subunit amino acid transport protein